MPQDIFKEYKRGGIFGASESGKTTVAKKVCMHLFKTEGRRALILDPMGTTAWGSHADVAASKEDFLAKAETGTNLLLVIDDSSTSLNRDDDFSGVFTVMRHSGHKVLVIGHNAKNLLPQMRDQLQYVILFLQNGDSVKVWKDLFPGQDLDQAVKLGRYEYLVVCPFEKMRKFKSTL